MESICQTVGKKESLARVANADILLLDNPLSAVDVHI